MRTNRLTILALGLASILACTDSPKTIELSTASTGIYEAHTTILSDTCVWDGEPSMFSRLPWSEAVFVNHLEGVSVPLQSHHGAIERYDLNEDQGFTFQFETPNECSTMVRDIRLLELFDDTVVTRYSVRWNMDEDCVPSAGVTPDTNCAIETEETMFLIEACDASCELRRNTLEWECDCSI